MSRRKMTNAATAILPPAGEPTRMTINNPGTPWMSIIFGALATVIVLVIFAWLSLVFLLGHAGFYRPERALAAGLLDIGLWLAIISLVFAISFAVGRYLLGQIFDYFRYRLDTQLEIHKLKMQTAQQLPATTANRMNREEWRKHQAIMMVMSRALDGMLDETGKLQTRTEPWSRRSVGLMRLTNEQEEIGGNSKLAMWVKPWLIGRGILLSDTQLNLAWFGEADPNLPAIQEALVDEFGPEINFGSGGAPMSGNYIEKGGKESWA